MAYNLKEVMTQKPSRLTSGHRMCAGCGAPAVVRMILRAVKPEDHVVASSATGCLEVSTFIYPYTAWTDSFIHTAFECSAATLSGAFLIPQLHTSQILPVVSRPQIGQIWYLGLIGDLLFAIR